MPPKRYQRMAMDVGCLISEVHTRPILWDKTSSGYSDRNKRDAAWLDICVALYPDWGEYAKGEQWVIEQDLRKRWKSVRDRFLRFHRQVPASGSPLSCHRKMPHYDELMFILPQRGLRPLSGNSESSQAESPDDDDGQQPREREPSPSSSVAGTEEVVGDTKELDGPSGVALRQPGGDTGENPALPSNVVDPPEATPAPRPAAPPRTSSTRCRSQRTRRTRDRLLEVEEDTRSLIRRVQAYDEYDFYAQGLAAACRRLPPQVRNDYMAFCIAAATDFGFATHPLRLGDLITHMRNFTRPRQQDVPPQPPTMVSTSTQTVPIMNPSFPQIHRPPLPPSHCWAAIL